MKKALLSIQLLVAYAVALCALPFIFLGVCLLPLLKPCERLLRWLEF